MWPHRLVIVVAPTASHFDVVVFLVVLVFVVFFFLSEHLGGSHAFLQLFKPTAARAPPARTPPRGRLHRR